jgi:hypothetical protein
MSGNDAALGEGFGRQIETLLAILTKEKSKSVLALRCI